MFRQEVFRDLEDPVAGGAFRRLGEALAEVRTTLERAGRMRHPAERDRWVLDAIERHDDALESLARALVGAPLASRGLLAVREHIAALAAAPAFRSRRVAAAATRAALEEVAVRLQIGFYSMPVDP